ncbi:aldolase/citrate lyase family protein [Acuticoccus yangtzensis]|uniref:aldolase/citrate lyase family protein n=1 Tax=Acuticoccus yangtzensis TaxID=1443441 RepID=UPI000A5A0D28|nr:aldolase/citrate lyase family protein [Acuticoccus yangtzensis]
MPAPHPTDTSEDMTAIGLAVCVLGTPEAVAVARRCGYDFLVVDMEHGPITVNAAAAICVAGQMGGFPVYVRVTGPASPDLARVLDCGATGVIIPHVDSLDDAREIVRRTRFPATGERALPGAIAHFGFEPVDAVTMVREAEPATRVIAMIESRSGLADAAAIAALDGIDALMIGSNDLAAAMGHLGALGHEEVLGAFRAIAGAAHASAKGFGAMGLPEPLVASHARDLGASLLVATNEINLIADGGRAVLGRYRDLTARQDAAAA